MSRLIRPAGALCLALPLLTLILVACDNSEEEDPGLRLAWVEGRSTTYDLREVWTYSSQQDPPQPAGADSVHAILTLIEEEAGTLYGQPARRIRESTSWYGWDNPVQPDSTHLVDSFYQSREEALLLLAYSGPGSLFLGVPGPSPLAPDERLTRRPGALPRPVAAPKRARSADDLVIEDPPLVVLLYPLREGLSWTYRQTGLPWRIDKEVLELGPADPDSTGERDCARLDWHFDVDADGAWDTGLALGSWLDGDGLISSEMRQELEVLDAQGGLMVDAVRVVSLRRRAQ